jgi:transcriptional regulator with XRE-family HTH domain
VEYYMTSTKIRTEDLDRVIGMRVRQARNEVNMSQDKLGQELGVTFQQIQKYEKGTNRIAASTLAQIAATLRKPITFFYDEVKFKPHSRGENIAQFIASRDGLKLIEHAVDLLPCHQQSLIEIARNLGKVAA